MNISWITFFFYTNVLAHGTLLLGAIWSIAFPERRFYPMRAKGQSFYAMWFLFDFILLTNAALVVLDWNTGPLSPELRFLNGGPLLVLGAAFLLWGIATLGIANTSGLRYGFVARGPYKISRNPQYVGDFFIFAGIVILANSEIVLVTHLLTALVLLLAPLAEEPWLEGEYGEEYVEYRRAVPRFL
jgi:protein-S-isoprenylcysteine O-methyltransferase Ste14